MNKKALTLLLVPFLIAGCSSDGGDGTTSENTSQPTSQQTSVTTGAASTSVNPTSTSVVANYTVKFANTSMADAVVQAGKSIDKPADPQKQNCIFAGWYTESSFENEVTFPMIINANTCIYAKFLTYKEAFLIARDKTVGEEVTGYEYDYTLDMAAGYMGLSLKGNSAGNTKYNSKLTDVSFYDEHVNSGALFYDGSKYSIKKQSSLHEISLNAKEVVKKYIIKNVGDKYRYDSSSFAKAIFEYSDEQIKNIEKTSTKNEYRLTTSINISTIVALIGNYANHPMVEKIIGTLPATSVATGAYVVFENEVINSYRYVMNINISDFSFSLEYKLSFKNVGAAPTIVPAVFNNTYVSTTDVDLIKAEINSYINDFKQLERSSYDFKVKTAVDYAKKNAINATVNGWTKRKVTSEDIYYLNDYEIDTDLKNADLYKEAGLKDCHAGRAKLSTGEVHDLKNKALGGYDDLGVIDHDEADNYYLLDVLSMLKNVSFIQKNTDTKTETATYSIGASTADVVNVLKEFNKTLRLNPLGQSIVDVKAFGSFDENSVSVKSFDFEIVVVKGALSEINLVTNGKMSVSYPSSRDFTTADDAGYKLSYNLTVTDKASKFEPAETVKKI